MERGLHSRSKFALFANVKSIACLGGWPHALRCLLHLSLVCWRLRIGRYRNRLSRRREELLDAVEPVVHGVLRAYDEEVADQQTSDGTKKKDAHNKQPLRVLDVLAHLGSGVLDVAERSSQGLVHLPFDLAALLLDGIMKGLDSVGL